jgi:DNA-binding LacI/PurR family transcriptional regulator
MPSNPVKRPGKQRLSAPYKKIETDIRRKICRGIWPVGGLIPSRQQLAREYGVDLSTIQKAVSTLLADGVVASDGTRGTYVSRLPMGDEEFAPEVDDARAVPPLTVADRTAWETPRMPATGLHLSAATKVIGIVGRFAPDISELLVPYILAQALENALVGNKDVRLKFFDSFCDTYHSVPIHEGATKLLTDRVDCLCVIYPEATDLEPVQVSAYQTATPVIYMPPERLDFPARQIYIDHQYDGFQAAKFYLDMGHRKLTYVGICGQSWSYARLAGVRAAVRSAGLPESALSVFPGGHDTRPRMTHDDFRDELQIWVQRQVLKGEWRGAYIAANDKLALAVLDVTDAAGLTPNQGFSLIGFDDVPEARRRGLTTLRAPLFDMGREAARMMTALLADGDSHGHSIHSAMVSQVVVRATAF